jgi:hypothetical protein
MFARLIQTPLVIRDLDNRGFVLGSIGSPVEFHHTIGEHLSLRDGDRCLVIILNNSISSHLNTPHPLSEAKILRMLTRQAELCQRRRLPGLLGVKHCSGYLYDRFRPASTIGLGQEPCPYGFLIQKIGDMGEQLHRSRQHRPKRVYRMARPRHVGSPGGFS